MQEGSLRADVNLSVRPVGQEEYGTRTEMKNINSFRAIARAIEAERKRQIELIEDVFIFWFNETIDSTATNQIIEDIKPLFA